MTPLGHAPLAELRGAESLVFCEDLSDPVLDSTDEHHLARVLRLRSGAMIAVANGAGCFRMARLVDARGNSATGPEATAIRAKRSGAGLVVVPIGPIRELACPSPSLTVAFAMPKGDRFELIVQKLTELGIDRIVPVAFRRSVVRPAGGEGARQARLARVAREACSQARRVHLPELMLPMSIDELLGICGDELAVAEPGGGPLDRSTRTIVIGPEGGFERDEIPNEVRRIGLGPTILRVETAAIAAGALLALRRACVVPTGIAG